MTCALSDKGAKLDIQVQFYESVSNKL